MLILAIDSAHKQGSITLARGDANSCQIIGTQLISGGTFSAQLIPELIELLAKHGVDKKQIEGYAASVGPGSFTGLRIGLSAVKGLAEVLPQPVVGVSSLEALASLTEPGNVLALLDAGRKELYTGRYRVAADSTSREFEALLSQQEVLDSIASSKPDSILTTESSVSDFLAANGIGCRVITDAASESVARVGLRKLAAKDSVLPELLDANYLRRDDSLFVKKA
jgi:tRNA threonylcarbamoyladenosine biosynthesis protein TsaB